MLTVDFERLRLSPGARVLDLGAGTGRHAAEAVFRGTQAVAIDRDAEALREARARFASIGVTAALAAADALHLPFADSTFDCVIVSEVLEHIVSDEAAMQEAFRVLREGGTAVVSVPRWYPEQVCWTLSDEYHANRGGHVRIYHRAQLESRLRRAGFEVVDRHHAHALHSPYWWLKCVGNVDEDRLLPRLYHRLLVWQILHRPRWLDRLERRLNPVLGKSLVVYLRRPESRGEQLHAA